MKIVSKHFLGISICILTILSGCSKAVTYEDPVNYRKDVFNCLVNGTRWDPARSPDGFAKAYIINSGNDEFFVTLDAGGPGHNYVSVHITGVRFAKGPVTYLINQDVPQNVLDYFVATVYPVNFGMFDDGWINSNNNSPMHKLHFTSAENTGEVIITKFTMEPAPMPGTFRGTIAGSFYFKALHPDTNETVNISDGNFEIEYWK